MIKQKALVRDLAKKYNLDVKVIEKVIKSPFFFFREKMESLDDIRAVRIPYFGVFSLKYGITQLNKQGMLIKKVVLQLKRELGNIPDDKSEFKRGVKYALDVLRETVEMRHGDPKEHGFEEE